MRRPVRWLRSASAAWLFLASLGPVWPAFAGGESATPGLPVFERVPAAFEGALPRAFGAFDLVTADFDLDGDADLLISWHHLAALELFENRDGRFVLRNPPGDPDGGLLENPEVPWLYARPGHAQRLAEAGLEGLALWHEPDRRGAWHLRWLDPGRRFRGWQARLTTSLGFTALEGPVRRRSPRVASWPLGDETSTLRVETRRIANELEIALYGGEGSPPPLWVGEPPQRVDGGQLALWLPDPHGLAWLDVEGTAHPELAVVRGALGGKLRAPIPPKWTRYYRLAGDAPRRYQLDVEAIPRDRGRDRRAAWVDLDGDGQPELCVGRTGRRPRLLGRRPGGGFDELAAGESLDAAVEAFAWADVDADGFDDLVWIGSEGLRFAASRRGRSFAASAPVPGASLPPVPSEKDPLHLPSLRVADFDADGALDLWALARGPERSHHLFLRRGDHFEDATERVGLARAQGHRIAVLADWDADGFEDAMSFGKGSALLWHNQRGQSFRYVALPPTALPESIRAAVALDADADGRTDLVVAGRRRHLLRNVSPVAPGTRVRLAASPAPVGARVRAVRPDGSGPVRRVGSASASAYGQGSAPLHFPAPEALERIEVWYPGDAQVRRHAPPRDRRMLELTR